MSDHERPSKLKRPLKLISDRWWDDIGKPSGYLWHYGHLVHDLLMPLNDWFLQEGVDPGDVSLFLQNTADQSVGPFVPVVEAFFGTTLTELPPDEFESLAAETITLQAYLFGPYTRQSCDNMLMRARAQFDLEMGDGPQVILIERGKVRHGFEADESLVSHVRLAGVDRRSISNHADVAQMLSDRYGDQFRNVALEDMPYGDQVRLFHGASLVIGQHGAGLNNVLWMNRPDAGLIEIGVARVPTFPNLCAAKGMRHSAICTDKSGVITVGLEDLSNALSGVEAASESLRDLCRATPTF